MQWHGWWEAQGVLLGHLLILNVLFSSDPDNQVTVSLTATLTD